MALIPKARLVLDICHNPHSAAKIISCPTTNTSLYWPCSFIFKVKASMKCTNNKETKDDPLINFFFHDIMSCIHTENIMKFFFFSIRKCCSDT